MLVLASFNNPCSRIEICLLDPPRFPFESSIEMNFRGHGPLSVFMVFRLAAHEGMANTHFWFQERFETRNCRIVIQVRVGFRLLTPGIITDASTPWGYLVMYLEGRSRGILTRGVARDA